MKDLQQWAAVHELHKRKIPKKKIAEQLGMSRNTVKRLLKLKEEPKYHRDCYPSKLDGYKEQVLIWRCIPYEFNGTRIYRELKKIGYQGSIGPVYRLLSRIDEDISLISSKATVRIETPVGDQAQFDWSHYQMLVGGRYCTVYCFSLILAACRKKAICFSLKMEAEAIYEAIQELFDGLGGITAELLIDNPKALVIENKPHSKEEIKYNPQAMLMAKHLGTELNACPCYWPRKKGKVEKPFQYIEEQFVKGNSFESMEDLNQRGKEFIAEWNDQIHGTTKRIPNEFYELEEKTALLPLPAKHYRMKEMQKRKISNDSLVSILAKRYSVPVKYVGKQVFFRIIYGFRIEIYDKKENLILKTETIKDKDAIQRNPEHYEAIAPKFSTSIPQIRRDFTKAFPHGELYLKYAGKKFDQPTHHARRILELLELYEAEVLDRFIVYAVKNDAMEIKVFKKLLKEKFREIAYLNESPKTQDYSNAMDIKKTDDSGILRDCSYYKNIGKDETYGRIQCN